MAPTTSYGTWANHAHTLSVVDTVSDYVNGGGDEWYGNLVKTGALDRIVDDFRTAINDRLAYGVTLHGDEFYGPANLPTDLHDDIRTAIRDAIDAVDLAPIVQRHDPDNTDGGDAEGTG